MRIRNTTFGDIFQNIWLTLAAGALAGIFPVAHARRKTTISSSFTASARSTGILPSESYKYVVHFYLIFPIAHARRKTTISFSFTASARSTGILPSESYRNMVKFLFFLLRMRE
jgi:hypothetical protein